MLSIVDLAKSVSDWVEPLSQMIKDTSGGPPVEVYWSGVERGVLLIERSGVVRQQMIVSDKLKARLVADGLLSSEDLNETHQTSK